MMEGYKRSPSMTKLLGIQLQLALSLHPEQRLGQLLDNLLSETLVDVYPDDVRSFMRLTHDEQWIERLARASLRKLQERRDS